MAPLLAEAQEEEARRQQEREEKEARRLKEKAEKDALIEAQ